MRRRRDRARVQEDLRKLSAPRLGSIVEKNTLRGVFFGLGSLEDGC